METTHPDDADLLAYVDEELPRDRRREIADHVDGCAECAQTVAKLEAGRDALRAAPLLKLPPTMRERVTMTLDRFGDAARVPPPRRSYVSPLRFATILAPVALALVLIVSLAELGDDDEAGRGAQQPAAAEAETSEGGDEAAGGAAPEAADEAAPSEAPLARNVVATVNGPAGDVAAQLRREGLDARVEGPRLVVVRGATAAAVRSALGARLAATGRVDVAVAP